MNASVFVTFLHSSIQVFLFISQLSVCCLFMRCTSCLEKCVCMHVSYEHQASLNKPVQWKFYYAASKWCRKAVDLLITESLITAWPKAFINKDWQICCFGGWEHCQKVDFTAVLWLNASCLDSDDQLQLLLWCCFHYRANVYKDKVNKRLVKTSEHPAS